MIMTGLPTLTYCFIIVLLFNQTVVAWKCRLSVVKSFKTSLECNKDHSAILKPPQYKEYLRNRRLEISQFFTRSCQLPSLIDLMGNFAYNSDSKRFLDAYKVYFSLLPSSTCDPIDLAPMLYTLSIFKLMNVKKQLKFVDEFEAVQDVGHLMENNHNPVHRFTSSLMGHSIGRHNLFPDKKLQFKPEFVEKLLEAAWYGSYYQHTLHFIKRMENLRYNKVFARPFNIYQLKALGLHGDLVDIKVCSQLTYLEIIALFVAMKQDLQYFTRLLNSRGAIDLFNSSSSIIGEHGFLMKCVLSVIASSTADEEQQVSRVLEHDSSYCITVHSSYFAIEDFLRKRLLLHSPASSPSLIVEHTFKSLGMRPSSALFPSLPNKFTVSNRNINNETKSNILVVGEGDFSFTRALCSLMMSNNNNNNNNNNNSFDYPTIPPHLNPDSFLIVSTCYNRLVRRKLQEAVSLQSVFPRVLRVLDEVDACDLQRSLNFKLPSITRFDSVYFTFPYANTNNNEETPSLKPFDSHFVGIGRHSQLIQAFLRSTKDVITPNGEVVMICFLSQLVVWEAEHIVEQEGWTLDKAYEFNYKVWKELGYVPKRTHGLDAFVSMSNGRGDGGEDVAYVVHFSRK